MNGGGEGGGRRKNNRKEKGRSDRKKSIQQGRNGKLNK